MWSLPLLMLKFPHLLQIYLTLLHQSEQINVLGLCVCVRACLRVCMRMCTCAACVYMCTWVNYVLVSYFVSTYVCLYA